MACCIFIAFIFSQLYAGYEAMLLFVGRKPQNRRATELAWRLDTVPSMPPPAQTATRLRPVTVGRSAFAAVIAIEVALAAGGVAWLSVGGGMTALQRDFVKLTQVRSVSDFADLCGF